MDRYVLAHLSIPEDKGQRIENVNGAQRLCSYSRPSRRAKEGEDRERNCNDTP